MKDSELNDNISSQMFLPFLSMIVTQRVCKKT